MNIISNIVNTKITDRLKVIFSIPALLYMLELTLSGLTNHGVDCGIHFFTEVSIGIGVSLPSVIVPDDEAVDETHNLKIGESIHASLLTRLTPVMN